MQTNLKYLQSVKCRHQQDLNYEEGGEEVAIALYGWRQERSRGGMTAPGLKLPLNVGGAFHRGEGRSCTNKHFLKTFFLPVGFIRPSPALLWLHLSIIK